ncbi:MAG TPA: NAD(P)/FAD-dependent oxidoreductase, partial [Chitinophagales bacterium]
KGESVTVKVLIGAIGPLNRPIIPNFKGLENFKGEQFHSSRWNHNYDLKNKRVAVIGTGASAIQIVPSIAPIVEDLVVFQRTAAWIAFRHSRANSAFKKKLYSTFPSLQIASRKFHYYFNEFVGLGFMGNEMMHKIATNISLKSYNVVKDKTTREKLIPNYKFGCKRVLKSDDYLPTFNRENVHLETSGIDHFTNNSIVTKDGTEYKIDAVIFGTGFEVTDFQTGTQLIGTNGRDIFEYWREKGVAAYHGMTVAHYPNFGLLLGPNTGLGHNSVVDIMESQMVYLMQYISAIEKLPANASLDVKQDIQDKHNEELQKQFDGTVWNSGCKSWYLDRNGKNVTLYPRLNTTYRNTVKHFNQNDFTTVN